MNILTRLLILLKSINFMNLNYAFDEIFHFEKKIN